MTSKAINMNTLFYGDNLPILRDYIADESVDLVYLDPPFNSNRGYNVLFRDESGIESESQIQAFDDIGYRLAGCFGDDGEVTSTADYLVARSECFWRVLNY
jgi:DNA modification methylase